jgi:hypothetical protein
MSRLTSMSPAAIRAVFSPEADADLYMLLTIYEPDNPSVVSLRLADGFTQRLSETSEDITYGVVSNGNSFIFLPMEITLPTEDEAQSPKCSITIHDVTRQIMPIIRGLNGPPSVKLQLVLSKTPDVIEASFDEFYLTAITYNAESVSAQLMMIDYDREPFPAHSFTPSLFPGIF